jgi:hypothetical protein
MQLKKAIMTLAMINFNLGMNDDNQNEYNQNLIQFDYLPQINLIETELSDMVPRASNVAHDLEINNDNQNQNN